LLDEVLAFLRAEATPRIAWRRRVWLGRRAAFCVVEAVLMARWWPSTRANEEARHMFAETILGALEQAGALDLLSCGRWAEETYEDPVESTQPAALRGQQTPRPAPVDPPKRLHKRPGRKLT
jgi:hypothetical protein